MIRSAPTNATVPAGVVVGLAVVCACKRLAEMADTTAYRNNLMREYSTAEVICLVVGTPAFVPAERRERSDESVERLLMDESVQHDMQDCMSTNGNSNRH